MSLERALELAEAARGRAYPKPTVGAVVVGDGEIVGEGVTRRPAGTARSSRSSGPVNAPAARRSTSRWSPARTTARRRRASTRSSPAGVARVVAGSLDPNPEAAGGLERLREPGVEVELVDSFEARAAERGLAHVGRARPAVRHLQGGGHARRPRHRPGGALGRGRGLRRLVHELRAASDAVAVGMGTVRRRTRGSTPATSVDAAAAAARVRPRAAAGGLGARAAPGPLEEELRALAAEGVQSLLLEGGPTLAAAFLRAGPRRQARCSSWPRCCPVRARDRRSPRPAAGALPLTRRNGRRRRPARGLPPRAVAHASRPRCRTRIRRRRHRRRTRRQAPFAVRSEARFSKNSPWNVSSGGNGPWLDRCLRSTLPGRGKTPPECG